MAGFNFLFKSGRKDPPECQRYGNVPFENAVFVGDSPQDMHGENADEQLANPQKRICLIEFLHLGLIIVCQGSGGAAKIDKTAFLRFFYLFFNTFMSSKVGDQK